MRLGALLLGLLATVAAAQTEGYRALVIRVVDGDTVWVRPEAGGGVRKLRLEGIDAPEICQTDGVAARDALKGLLLRQWVQVRGDARDDYGRDLVRLQWQDLDLGDWMVRQGWAWSYRWRGGEGPYAAQEAQAKAQRLGLHARERTLYPGVFRRQHGPCRPS